MTDGGPATGYEPEPLIVLDDDPTGAQALSAARILAFSAYSDHGAVTSMHAAGVDEYLVKGVTNAEFLAVVRRIGGRVDGGSSC